MKGISVCSCFDYSIPIEKQFELVKSAGFDMLSIGGNYEHSNLLASEGLKNIARLSKTYDLHIDTVHGYGLYNSDAIEINKKIIEAANVLSASVVVIHCSPFYINPETFESRKAELLSKLPSLEKAVIGSNVQIAFENLMPGAATELMKSILDNSSTELFGFCYDSAHDQVDGPNPFDLLNELENRLLTVHLSDRIKEFVDHATPGEGFIDFSEIEKILKRNQYSFPLQFEVMTTHSKYKEPESFLAQTHKKALEIFSRI